MLSRALYISIATNQLYAESTTATRLESQTVTFRDANPEWEVSMKAGTDTTRDVTYHGDVELQDFFSRPIPIKNYSWTPGGTWANDTFDPWTLFLSNKRVSNRINNYLNFSATMCVKFIVNGNSFYYGRLMAVYSPLPTSDNATLVTDGVAGKMLNSQRMKIFIDPCESQAGVMRAPFAWFYDKVNILSASSIGNLGDVSILSLNELKHANGSATPVTITVYAWMENVKLSSPTATNTPLITTQSGDEYGSGIISAPASATAKMTGALSKTPVIGKYMKATSIATGAVANVARMFGMSRPAVVSTPTVMIPRYVNGFAVTDVADTVSKLTVDSKQELSIDSSVTGFDCGDELVLKHIASREAYLTTCNWLVSHSPNTILFGARVNPTHTYTAGTPAYTTIPACTYAAMPFQYWRGTMKYRFQVVSSAYHKGRLLVVWDPDVGAIIPEQNVQYSKIIDISSEKDFTMDIGWGQPRTWLEVAAAPATYYASNALTYITPAETIANGVLTVYVLNDLTTPNSAVNNDIQINVYVSMCDDAEFAAPINRIRTYAPYTGTGVTPQAGGDLETEPDNNIPVNDDTTEKIQECIDDVSPTDLIYMGETISSFRQLMHRYNLLYAPTNLGASQGYFTWTTSDFPIGRGYYANGLRSGAVFNYNNVNTTMMNYLAFAFIMYRGGSRRRIVLQNGSAAALGGTMGITRAPGTAFSPPTLTNVTITTAALAEDQSLALNSTSLAGMHLTVTSQQPVLEVELPFYTNARFVACRTGYATSSFPSTVNSVHQMINYAPTALAIYNTYVSAAEDSTFHCFQGCIPFQVTPTFS